MSRFSSLPLALALTLLAAVACLTPLQGPATPARRGTDAATTARASNVIALDELVGVKGHTAYDAVLRLRPQFLWRHGSGRADQPGGDVAIVYLDGRRQGPPEMLRSIPIDMVREIRFLTPVEAANELGVHHAGGVIALRTRG